MITCPNCQLQNEEGGASCFSCGQSLEGAGGDGETRDSILGGVPSAPSAPAQGLEEVSSDKALEEYERAIARDPQDPELYFNRGILYLDMGESALAIEDFDQAVRLSPDEPDFHLHRGVAYENLDQYDNAILEYSHVIRIEPEDSDAWVNRGVVYFKTGDYQRALSDFAESARLEPEDGVLYAYEALAATLAGMDSEADDLMDQAVELGVDDTLLSMMTDELKKRR